MPADAAERDARVNAALAEFLAAAGRPFDRSAWLARHSDVAAELAEFLDDQAAFAGAAAPLVGPTADPQTTPPAADARTRTFDGDGTLTEVGGPPGGGRFGDYEIIEEIARGGMGVVYKARQISLNRVVALKMIAPDRLEGRAERDRFRREAEAAAGLDHPNIVPIYEVGEADGRSYFSMKLVEGGSLAQHLAQSPRPYGRGLSQLLSLVARAVHYAHQRGILHRDLKPSNILLGPAGDPLVADFGLAKRLDGPAEVSRSGVIVGTPAYMAPEQARGEKGLTTAADVYGLGAILYEGLTGRPPFRARSAAETLVFVLAGDPARPRSIDPAVPADLEAICLKCLAKDPAGRYGSAEALADDLDRWSRGEPITARAVTRTERAIKWVRRHPAGASLIGVGVVAIGAILGTAVALAYNARLAKAKGHLEEANGELQKANDARTAALVQLEGKNAEAERLRTTADAEREKAQGLLYVARFRQAEQAWQGGRPALAAALLFDSPEATGLRRFAGIEETLSGIGQVQVRPLRVPWVKPPRIHLAEPTQTVSLAELTPDGRTAVLIHPTGTVSWWDTEAGTCLGRASLNPFRTVVGVRATFTHTFVLVSGSARSEVRMVGHGSWRALGQVFAFHTVITADFDNQPRWRIETPEKVPVLNWSVSQDGSHVALACGDGRLRVWTVPDGKPVAEILGFGPNPTPFAISADGARVARGGAEPAVWKLGTPEPEWVLSKREPGAVWRAVAFRPDGRVLGVATDQAVELWTAGSDAPAMTVVAQAGVTNLEFGPDGQSLVAVEADRRATVWDPRGRPLATFVPDRAPLFRARAARGGVVVAAGGRDHPVDVHRVRVGRPETAVIPLPNPPHSVALSPDGRRAVATLRDGSVGVWATSDGRLVCTLRARTELGFSRAAFSPDGRTVAVGSGRGVNLCDAADGRVITTLPAEVAGAFAYVYDVAFSPDGTLLAAGTAKDATVWDLRTGRAVYRLRERVPPGARPSGWMVSVRFSPDGHYLATGSGSWDTDGSGQALGYVGVWDLQTGQQVFLSPGQPDGIYGLSWSPDGRRLASGSGRYQFGGPGGVHVWEPASGRVIFDLKGHTHCVWAVAFSPDGRRLVSAGGPFRSPYSGQDERQNIPAGAAEVRVWDMGSGQELLSARLHTATVYGAAFAPDGRSFATAGWDKLIRIWRTGSDTETADVGRDRTIRIWDGTPLAAEENVGHRSK
jgi:eukaryotic-like serine/threonine-protein kinase